MKFKFKKFIRSRKCKDLVFYCLMLALPVTQFCIFYIGVNVNSVLLSFKQYDNEGGYVWAGLSNFTALFAQFKSNPVFLNSLKNSLIYYVVHVLIGSTLGLIFSYYIYKKQKASGFFRVILFLPSIIPVIVLIKIFSQFADSAVPTLINKIFDVKMPNLLSDPSTQFPTIIFYNVWISFGVSVLLYVNAMNTISESVLEAAKIDGITPLKEFLCIVFPLIYPTWSTLFTVGIANIGINQLNLYSFYGSEASYSVYTFGYYLFKNINGAPLRDYPRLAALGLCLSVVTLPIVLAARRLLVKIGPTTE